MTRADRRKFHIIYKTTCKTTGRFYIGMHSTDDLNDGYKGSGTILWHSLKKYGKDDHVCEILEFLPNRKALAEREAEIITEEVRNDPACMNLKGGGIGNTPGMSLKKPKQTAEQIANRVAKNTGQKRSDETKAKMRQAQARYLATVTPEKRAMEHENRSKAKSKTWIVVKEDGEEIVVTNLRKFAEENKLPESMFYKTRVNGKYLNGFRVKGLA